MKEKIKIMIVDDELEFLSLCAAFLQKKGFDVCAVSEGSSVFDKLKTFAADIMVLDVKLGTADGREICNQIKANAETRDIKVILQSAYKFSREESYGCEPETFLQKPYFINDLLKKIEYCLP